ncbi:MAG: hypothetical protein IJU76_07625 [Desulfovibrionaceae bacterium]|nr:hypothetical protein [Desulfovibrionaceae bacterium]
MFYEERENDFSKGVRPIEKDIRFCAQHRSKKKSLELNKKETTVVRSAS